LGTVAFLAQFLCDVLQKPFYPFALLDGLEADPVNAGAGRCPGKWCNSVRE
jgi:hypothetical protein